MINVNKICMVISAFIVYYVFLKNTLVDGKVVCEIEYFYAKCKIRLNLDYFGLFTIRFLDVQFIIIIMYTNY